MALSWRRLAAYGAPGLPLAALTLPVYVLIPSFYIQTLGADAALVGALLLAIRAADAFTDPLAGHWSDRMRTPIGRRRPMMLAGAPLAAFAALMLFTPPAGAGAMYMGVWTLALTLGWTLIVMPYAAWGAELSGEYHERTRIVAVREGLIVAGTLIALSIPAAAAYAGGTDKDGLALLGLMIVCALPLAILICALFVPEPENPLPASSLRGALPFLKSNAAFRRLLIAYLINGTANGLPATLFVLFVTHGFGAGETAPALLFVYFLCGAAGVPVWTALARRWGKHRAWGVAMIVASAVFLLTPLSIAMGSLAFFAGICVVTGLCLGADLVLPAAIQADAIDSDTAESGAARAGLYVALWSVATKLALALAAGVALPVLDAFGFDAADARQSDAALIALTALYAVIPVALKAAAIAMMWNYPVDAARQAAQREAIAARITAASAPRSSF